MLQYFNRFTFRAHLDSASNISGDESVFPASTLSHHLYQLENGSKLSYVVQWLSVLLCSFQDGTVLCLLLNKISEGAIPSLVSAKERNVGLEIKFLFAKNSLIEHYSSLNLSFY